MLKIKIKIRKETQKWINISLFLAGMIAMIILGISTASATNINTCQDLTTGNYTLTASVGAGGTCFNISGNNIVLYCQGYQINYSNTGVGYGINNSNGHNNITVNDCRINQNNTAYANSYGILLKHAQNNTFNNVTIFTIQAIAHGIYLWNSSVKIENVKINLTGNTAYGIVFTESSNNFLNSSIINSSIITHISAYSIWQEFQNGTQVITNTLLNSKGYLGSNVRVGGYNLTNCSAYTTTGGFIIFAGGSLGKVNVHWYLEAYVNNSAGTPVSGATVKGYTVNGSLGLIQTTSANGNIARQTLLEYMQNATRKYIKTNYTINATNGFFWSDTKQINLTSNKIDSNNNYTLEKIYLTLNNPIFDVSCATGLPVLNYTFLEESNRTTINGTANVNILIWDIEGLKSLATNYSFSTTTADSFRVCANGNYSADVYITSTSAFQGKSYVQKTYYLLNAILNTSSPQYDFLHQLPTSSSTSVILQVLDQGYSPLGDHYVKIQRYYISENAWRNVEIVKTDDNGYSLTHLVEEDVDYKFIVQNYDTVLKTTSSMRIICLATPCILEIRVSEESNPYQYLLPDGLSYNFYYINDTKTVYLDWTDTSGESVTMRLVVTAKTTREDIVVCNSSLPSSSGTLTCDLSGRTEENFYARIFRGTSPEQLLNNLWASLTTTYLRFGNEGVIFSFLLMLTMTLIGIWNPSVGLILLGGTFVVMMLFNFIYMTPMIIGAVAVIIILGVRYLRT